MIRLLHTITHIKSRVSAIQQDLWVRKHNLIHTWFPSYSQFYVCRSLAAIAHQLYYSIRKLNTHFVCNEIGINWVAVVAKIRFAAHELDHRLNAETLLDKSYRSYRIILTIENTLVEMAATLYCSSLWCQNASLWCILSLFFVHLICRYSFCCCLLYLLCNKVNVIKYRIYCYMR